MKVKVLLREGPPIDVRAMELEIIEHFASQGITFSQLRLAQTDHLIYIFYATNTDQGETSCATTVIKTAA